MPTDPQDAPRPLPDRPNLHHLKDQAKDLLKTGVATSVAAAQFQIARLYGFASWPKLARMMTASARITMTSALLMASAALLMVTRAQTTVPYALPTLASAPLMVPEARMAIPEERMMVATAPEMLANAWISASVLPRERHNPGPEGS